MSDTIGARNVDMNRDHFIIMAARGSKMIQAWVAGDEVKDAQRIRILCVARVEGKGL